MPTQPLSLHLRYRMTRAARLANHLRIPRARAQHPVQPHHQLARDRHLGDPVVLFAGQAFIRPRPLRISLHRAGRGLHQEKP